MYAVWWVVWRLLARGGAGEAVAMLVAIGTVTGLMWLQVQMPEIRYMPYLLIVPANLLASWFFARSLVSERNAILVDLIEIMGLRPIEPRFRRFVEGQCLLWSVMCLGTAIAAALAIGMAEHRPALAGLLSALVMVQIVWFALSHYYASFRYGRPETWGLTLRTMIRPDVWARLGFQ
ncbi:MAG: hypothetical protein AAFV19_06425 [Pseudomonadota bacterium]